MQIIERQEAKNGRKIVGEGQLKNLESGKEQRININGDAWVSLTCENNDWQAGKLLSHKETWHAEARQVKQVWD